MDENEKLKEFHGSLIKSGYSVPDYNTFEATLKDPMKAKEFYDSMVSANYELPDYETFSTDLGLKKKDASEYGLPSKEVFSEMFGNISNPDVSERPPDEFDPNKFKSPDLTLKTPEFKGPEMESLATTMSKYLSGERITDREFKAETEKEIAKIDEELKTLPKAEMQLGDVAFGADLNTNKTPEEAHKQDLLEKKARLTEAITTPTKLQYILGKGYQQSLLGIANKLLTGGDIVSPEWLAKYDAGTLTDATATALGFMIDFPFFNGMGKVSAEIGKKASIPIVNRVMNNSYKRLVASGIEESLAKELSLKAATKVAQGMTSSISSGVTLGSYGAVNEALSEWARPDASFDDIKWSNVFKRGMKDTALGFGVGGLGLASAALAQKANAIPSLTGRVAGKVGAGIGGLTAESGLFTYGGALLDGKSPKDVTGQDFLNTMALLGILKGSNLVGKAQEAIADPKKAMDKLYKSLQYDPQKPGQGQFQVDLDPWEISSLGEKDYNSLMKTVAKDDSKLGIILQDENIPALLKQKVLWGARGVAMKDINLLGDKVVLNGENTDIYNKEGVLVDRRKFSSPEEALQASIDIGLQLEDNKMQMRSAMPDVDRIKIISDLKNKGVDTDALLVALDKPVADRTPEESKMVGDYYSMIPKEKKSEENVPETVVQTPEDIAKEAGVEYIGRMQGLDKSLDQYNVTLKDGNVATFSVPADSPLETVMKVRDEKVQSFEPKSTEEVKPEKIESNESVKATESIPSEFKSHIDNYRKTGKLEKFKVGDVQVVIYDDKTNKFPTASDNKQKHIFINLDHLSDVPKIILGGKAGKVNEYIDSYYAFLHEMSHMGDTEATIMPDKWNEYINSPQEKRAMEAADTWLRQFAPTKEPIKPKKEKPTKKLTEKQKAEEEQRVQKAFDKASKAKKKIEFKPGSRTYEAINKTPNNFTESALQYFAGGGRLNTEDFIKHTGYKRGTAEFNKYFQLLSNNGAKIDVFNEKLANSFGKENEGPMAMINEVIDLMKSHNSRGKMLTELERLQGAKLSDEEMPYEPSEEEIKQREEFIAREERGKALAESYDIDQALKDGLLTKAEYDEIIDYQNRQAEAERLAEESIYSDLAGEGTTGKGTQGENGIERAREIEKIARDEGYTFEINPDADPAMTSLDVFDSERKPVDIESLPKGIKDLADEYTQLMHENKVSTDSGTAITDSEGKPLTVYHGTNKSFTEFDKGEIGTTSGNGGFFGDGFYFTSDKDIAGQYGGNKGRVVSAQLIVKSPFELFDSDEPNKVLQKRSRDILLSLDGLTKEEKASLNNKSRYNATDLVRQTFTPERFRELLTENGYDGVIIRDSEGSFNADEYVVFDKSQIKISEDQKGIKERLTNVELKPDAEKSIPLVPKTEVRTLDDGAKVYEVDGTFIRDNIYADWTMGGNEGAYPSFVPKGEVWIDKDMNPKEKEATIIHEQTERKLMLDEGMTYDDAHVKALEAEGKYRETTANEKPDQTNLTTGKGEENNLPGGAETGKEPIAPKGEGKPPRTTDPVKQRQIDTIDKEYDAKIAEAQKELDGMTEEKRNKVIAKAQAEVNRRNTIFGDADAIKDGVIKPEDQGFVPSNKPVEKAAREFDERKKELQNIIDPLNKERESKIGEVLKQQALGFEEPTKPDIESYNGKKFVDTDGNYQSIEVKVVPDKAGAYLTLTDKNGVVSPRPMWINAKDLAENINSGYWSEKPKTETSTQKFLTDKELIGTAKVNENGNIEAEGRRFGSEFGDASRGGTWYEIPAFEGQRSSYEAGWWGTREANMGVGGKEEFTRKVELKNPYFVNWGGFGEGKIIVKIANDVLGKEVTDKLKKGITGYKSERAFAKLEKAISDKLSEQGHDGILIYDQTNKMVHPKQAFVFGEQKTAPKIETPQAQGIPFKNKTYQSVEDVQDALANGDITFNESKKLMEDVRKFEDGLKKNAKKNSDSIGNDIISNVNDIEKKIKRDINDKNSKLFLRLFPDVISMGNTALWKQLKVVRDGMANTIANQMSKGVTSQIGGVRWTSKALSNLYNGLVRTQADMFGTGLPGQIGKLEMLGTTKAYAPHKAHDLLTAWRDIVGSDIDMLRRVRDVMDPEIATEKLTYGDLSLPEKNLHDMLRKCNTWVHETNYANDLIDTNTYLKFKDVTGDSKYIARLYDTYEDPILDPAIKQYIERGNSAVTTRMFADMYKARKEMDDWKKEHAITDPAYLTAKRVMQTIQNVAIKQYMDQIIATHPNFVKQIKKGADIPKGYTLLSSSRKWGPLRNRAVANHIVEDFTGFYYQNQVVNTVYDAIKMWDRTKLNQFYKKYRTVYNPFVQTGNVTGNIFFASINGINPGAFVKGMIENRNLHKTDPGLYDLLLKSGLIGDTAITGEMKPLDILEPATGGLGKADELATKAYVGADNLAKISAYQIFRRQGLSHQDAVRRAYDAFQNYATVGKTWDFTSKLPLIGPTFVKFQADLQRILVNNLLTTPLTTIGTLLMIKAAGNLASALSGETEEEQKVRESRKGVAKIPFVNIPLSFKVGKSEFNVARYLSPLYLYNRGDSEMELSELSKFMPIQFQQKEEGKIFPLPAFADATWGWLGSVITDKDFRGVSIADPSRTTFNDPNTPTDVKIFNIMNYIARSQIPFYKGTADIINGATGQLDYYGRKRNWYQAILNNVVKVQEFDKPELKNYVERNLDYLTSRYATLATKMGDAQGNFYKEMKNAEDKGMGKEAMDRLYRQQSRLRDKAVANSLQQQIPIYKEIERLTEVYKKWHPEDPFLQENYQNIESGKNQRFNVLDEIDLQKNYKDEYLLLKKNKLLNKPDIPKYYQGVALTDEQKKKYSNIYWSEYIRQLDAMIGLTQQEFDEQKDRLGRKERADTPTGVRDFTRLEVLASEAASRARSMADRQFKY